MDYAVHLPHLGYQATGTNVTVTFPQRARVLEGVDLAPALRGRRKSVHDDEHPHQTVLDRSGFHPRAADSPPRY